MQPPVIVVPGMTASELRDEYPVGPDTVWSLFHKQYERVALHPDDDRYEVVEPARVQADRVMPLAYSEIIEELRHNLTTRADEPTPVYPFAYDWRQPLDVTERRLAEFVDEVIARTKLMRHYHRDGYADAPCVDIVGHSMGGLIIAGLLARRGRDARVRKVVTLGTPFGGSFEAVLKITTGTSDLNEDAGSSREREMARVTPSLYHLLPSFAGGVMAPRGVPSDLFDTRAWQPSIAETIAEYIRLHGLDPRKTLDARLRQAREIFQRMLDVARVHRARIDAFSLDTAGLAASDWLCVAGVGEETRVRIKIELVDGAPCFDLRSDDRLQGYPDGRKSPLAAPVDTGDGTVPFLGAVPPFLARENLVCVTGDDFGYWELRDRGLGKFATLHALLARMNLVHRLIAAFFSAERGKPAAGNRAVWGRSAPGVARWTPPFADLRQR